jgi:hypothetical protein
MSRRPLRLQFRSLLIQFLEPSHHEVIQCKANYPDRFDRLLRPRKPNLLSGTGWIILCAVGPMNNVVTALHSGVECFLDFFFCPAELVGNETPRGVQAQQYTRYVDASSAIEIAEVQAAYHFVGDKQRVGISQNADGFIEVELQFFELVLERIVVPWDEIPSSQSDHFG